MGNSELTAGINHVKDFLPMQWGVEIIFHIYVLGTEKIVDIPFPIALFIQRVILLQCLPKNIFNVFYGYKRRQAEIKSTKL